MKADRGFTVRRGGSLRRAGGKARSQAEPADIHSVYDNGAGSALGRYTIVMTWPGRYPEKDLFDALVLSDDPDSPGGLSQFGAARVGPHLGQRITFYDLPENVQEHAVRRLSHKEVQSQEGLIVDAIHNAWIILPKALEYARNGEIETTLVMCRGAAGLLTTAISHLEQVKEIG